MVTTEYKSLHTRHATVRTKPTVGPNLGPLLLSSVPTSQIRAQARQTSDSKMPSTKAPRSCILAAEKLHGELQILLGIRSDARKSLSNSFVLIWLPAAFQTEVFSLPANLSQAR